MEKQQNDLVNVIKGVGMFFVLWGHSIIYCSAYAFDYFQFRISSILHSVSMPLFIMVSGYLFWYSLQKRTFLEIVTRRTRQMLQPMVMLGTIVYLTVDLVLEVLHGGTASLVKFFIHGIRIEAFSKYWFLWSVLSCSIVVALIWKGIKKPAYRVPAFIFGLFLFCLFPQTTKSIFLYPFFVIGVVFHEYEKPLKDKLEKFSFVPLIVYPILCAFLRKEHCIDEGGLDGGSTVLESLGIDMYRWIAGLFACLFVIVAVRWLYGKFNKGVGEKIFDFFIILGKRSLQIYCLQVIVLEKWFAEIYKKIVEMTGKNFLSAKGFYPYVFPTLLALLLAAVLLKLIEWMDKKGISKYLFGR